VATPGPAGASPAAARRLVRASRTVVRPGRKGGATTLVFKLSRPAVLRFTIVRVYPSCERIGSFSVRGHPGVNRVPFRGRLRGRALPDGTYHLRVRPKGARADVAVVTVVIVNGKRMSAAEVRKARHASVCRSESAVGETIQASLASGDGGQSGESPGGVEAVLDRAKKRIGKTATAFSAGVRELPRRLDESIDDPFSPFVLIIVGLLTLAIATLGTLLLAQLARMSGMSDRTAR
jgi:hypothetical protein